MIIKHHRVLLQKWTDNYQVENCKNLEDPFLENAFYKGFADRVGQFRETGSGRRKRQESQISLRSYPRCEILIGRI
jgi:hypothetical protein